MPMLLPQSGAVAGRRHVLLEVLEHVALCASATSTVGRLDLGQQPRLRVHLAHEVVHRARARRRRRGRRARCRRRAASSSASVTMHAISTITSLLDVEPGHLEVDPHQPVVVGVGRSCAARCRTLPARGARVDSAPMTAPAVVWRPDADAAARQQRRAVHGGRGHRRLPDARRAVDRRAGVVLGRGRAVPRHPVLAAVRPRCSTLPTASRGRSGSPAGAATSRSTCVDRCADDPATRDDAAVVWEGEDGDGPHAHVDASCAR